MSNVGCGRSRDRTLPSITLAPNRERITLSGVEIEVERSITGAERTL